jgi:hypothetical protein
MWFRNKQDEGISYSFYFNPFTIPALALVLTAVSPSHPYYSLFFSLPNVIDRLNAALMSGSPESRPTSPLPLHSIKMYMKTTFIALNTLRNIRRSMGSSITFFSSFIIGEGK